MLDNKYQLVNILGNGGSAKVFLAKNESGDKCAVKIIDNSKKFAPRAAMRIVHKEHEALQYLSDHPNIIKSLGFSTNGVLTHGNKSEHVMYNVLECAENGTIADYIRNTGPIEESIASFFCYQICHAVNHMHCNQ